MNNKTAKHTQENQLTKLDKFISKIVRVLT